MMWGREETGRVAFHLMTPCLPQPAGENELALVRSGRKCARIRIAGPRLHCRIEAIELDDERLQKAWGSRLYRIVLEAAECMRNAAWTFEILSEEEGK